MILWGGGLKNCGLQFGGVLIGGLVFFGVLGFGFRVFWSLGQRRCKLESVMNILITDMSSRNMTVSLINHADVVHAFIMKDMYCHAQA